MISEKQFVAIDLGGSSIRAMAAEMQDNGAFKILSCESMDSDDVKCGIVEQTAAPKISTLQKYLQNSSKITEISMVSVAVGARTMKQIPVAVSRYIGKERIITNQLLNEMKEECRNSFQHPNISIYDIIPTSFEVDGVRVFEPISKTGSQIVGNYNLIVGTTLIKDKQNSCFERTGLIVEHSPLAVEALSAVLLEDTDREDGCGLIDFGSSTTTFAAYWEGVLQYLMVVPLGANTITKDIEELGVNATNAEKLKCKMGNALESMVENPVYVQIPSSIEGAVPVRISTQFLATVIESRLEEILHPIVDAISLLPFSLDAGIVITGGGSKLNNIIDFIQSKTEIPTRYGNHTEWLSDDTDETFFDPSYARLIGTLVLTGDYRKNHPIEQTVSDPDKKPKLKKTGKIREKVSQGFLNFFSDENKMNS
jgi:cell division protein FtsA